MSCNYGIVCYISANIAKCISRPIILNRSNEQKNIVLIFDFPFDCFQINDRPEEGPEEGLQIFIEE